MTSPEPVIPAWMEPVRAATRSITAGELSRYVPPPGSDPREGAVLMLFGEGPEGRDLLLTERAHHMRSHPGQISFPGGKLDPTDASPTAAALREAQEETGLDPAGVDVFATLPALYVPPSGFVVTPVLGWWREPSPVSVVDPAEVASVHRIPLGELLDPANRLHLRHPGTGYVGPAFRVRSLLIWGFTAGLLSRLLQLSGMERPWDNGRVEELPPEALALAVRTYDRRHPPTDTPA